MTTPTVCACGIVHLGECAGPMSVCLYPGFAFDGSIQLTDKTGTPIDWPAGMTARIRVITAGTGSTVLLFPGQMISGTWMYLSLTGAETLTIPRGAEMYLDVDYDDGKGWRPWRKGRIGRCN